LPQNQLLPALAPSTSSRFSIPLIEWKNKIQYCSMRIVPDFVSGRRSGKIAYMNCCHLRRPPQWTWDELRAIVFVNTTLDASKIDHFQMRQAPTLLWKCRERLPTDRFGVSQ
jgi:hypothetical protein